MTRRPLDGYELPVQFAALPVQIQSRLFGFVDILLSMDAAQIEETRQALSALAAAPVLADRPFVRGMLSRAANLVMAAHDFDEVGFLVDQAVRDLGVLVAAEKGGETNG